VARLEGLVGLTAQRGLRVAHPAVTIAERQGQLTAIYVTFLPISPGLSARGTRATARDNTFQISDSAKNREAAQAHL
jgi:hypothetical protein